jgi:hypothetical protein
MWRAVRRRKKDAINEQKLGKRNLEKKRYVISLAGYHGLPKKKERKV